MDPKLFSSWVHRSVVLGVVETGVWTAEKQPVALLAKKGLDSAVVQVIPQQAIKAYRCSLLEK
jgi:hypothetical protein